MELEINTTVKYDVDDLASELYAGGNEEELFELITLIDSNVAEYDFTKKLYKYFKEQYKNDKADKKRMNIV